MENDVLYNRIMNKVHEEYGSGGGGGGGMLLTISQSGDDIVLDKNYKEIKTAIDSGIIPFYLSASDKPNMNLQEMHTAFGYGDKSGNYFINFCVQLGEPDTFISDSEEGVLTLIQES